MILASACVPAIISGYTCAMFRLLTLALAATVVLPAAGQTPPQGPKPSQRGTVSQRINDTTVTIDYSRPVARGRELFGKLVPYGRVWCPGADDATTIDVSTDVTIDGHALPKGKYSLWAEPNADKWVMIVNRVPNVFHTKYPAGQDAFRVEIAPRAGQHMETLAFYFPVVEGRKAELVFHWGTVIVPLAIEVP
jgi:hypothetical protein